MKIKITPATRMTIEQFADKHGLTMKVTERDSFALKFLRAKDKYYAQFDDAEIKEGSILESTYGNGQTPEAAIRDYAKKIEGRLMVICAYRKNRREIVVPEIIETTFKSPPSNTIKKGEGQFNALRL